MYKWLYFILFVRHGLKNIEISLSEMAKNTLVYLVHYGLKNVQIAEINVIYPPLLKKVDISLSEKS